MWKSWSGMLQNMMTLTLQSKPVKCYVLHVHIAGRKSPRLEWTAKNRVSLQMHETLTLDYNVLFAKECSLNTTCS